MEYRFCPVCNKFTVDAALHVNSCVHTSLVQRYNRRFRTSVDLIEISSDVYRVLMDVEDICIAQSSTVSEYELAIHLKRVNPVSTLIEKLKNSDTPTWPTIVSAFVRDSM